jgi:ATP-dependent helicase HrpA
LLPTAAQLRARLRDCLIFDRHRLESKLHAVERSMAAALNRATNNAGAQRRQRDRRGGPGNPAGPERSPREISDQTLARIADDIDRSAREAARRHENRPKPAFDADLPILARKDEICKAILGNQVVIICGETGSGKSTQLPKLCLELGGGVLGLIGHTQPRRIAARSIAARLAEELQCPMGREVGFKVRFTDTTSPNTYIKVMTDGVLLAETQADRLLTRYDTLIIDEAHERSLNIDFLLGYLKLLLPRRPDLKVIVTSATIDPQRFSVHFNNAPIIEVSGRTYPVEVRYRPPPEDPGDDIESEGLPTEIARAADELALEGPGDILVFLPGEREIREAAEELHKHHVGHQDRHARGTDIPTEIVPLYARLSADEQNRIFKPHRGRRIVLATNVAETSLTVPGIKYVIDSGLARMSRYSPRSKVQGLPIERISQASAKQRAGRCGRVSPGICIRLYAQDDHDSREAFTEPEILRTNLASVILQMKSLRLGTIDEFPFIDRPSPRLIKDGYDTLTELGAIDANNELTPVGQRLAKLPIDPRIARMIIAAEKEQALAEVLIIAAALSVQDPRDRPMDKRDKADEAHAAFEDPDSDFLSFLKLWHAHHEQSRQLSHSKLRKWCAASFLSFIRMREWHDVHAQLLAMVTEHGSRLNSIAATPERIHRALLTGLLCNIGNLHEEGEYRGAHDTKFRLFPGSGQHEKKPKWIMAAEIVRTTRVYARTIGRIRPEWAEELGAHLVKRSYTDPVWDKRSATVVAQEHVSLFGIELVAGRRANYGKADPYGARKMFIHHALVEFDWDAPRRGSPEFMRHNRALVQEIRELESKGRRWDLLLESEARYAFFDKRVPESVIDGHTFDVWRMKAEKVDPKLLFMTRDDVIKGNAAEITPERFPDHLVVHDDIGEGLGAAPRDASTLLARSASLKLEYKFEPGAEDDGVTVTVPLAALPALDNARCDWLVPGLLKEKVTELIRGLPGSVRKLLGPAPTLADEFLAAVTASPPAPDVSLTEALADYIGRSQGHTIPADAWPLRELPAHQKMRVVVIDERNTRLAAGRDLPKLKSDLTAKAGAALANVEVAGYNRDGLTDWDFPTLPDQLTVDVGGLRLLAFPAITDEGRTAGLRLMPTRMHAARAMHDGLRRLFLLRVRREIRAELRNSDKFGQLLLAYSPLGKPAALEDQLALVIAEEAFLYEGERPRDDAPASNKSAAKAAKAAEKKGGLTLTLGGGTLDISAALAGGKQTARAPSTAAQQSKSHSPRVPDDIDHDPLPAPSARGGAGRGTIAGSWRHIRTREQFNARLDIGRAVLHRATLRVLDEAALILDVFRRIVLRIDALKAAHAAEAVADEREHLNRLFPPRFFADTPKESLQHFPRYLSAIEWRLDKLAHGRFDYDDRCLSELTGRWRRCFTALDIIAHDGREPMPELVRHRWLLEEYRVSLFAQQLGTTQVVSAKRIDDDFERVLAVTPARPEMASRANSGANSVKSPPTQTNAARPNQRSGSPAKP